VGTEEFITMNKKQFFLGLILASFIGALIAVGGIKLFEEAPVESEAVTVENTSASFTSMVDDANFTVPDGLNFVYAAEVTTPTVVHIQSNFNQEKGSSYGNSMEDLFRDFFGNRSPNQERTPQYGRGFGSGVIISADGYIVTNNHVIDDADEVQVTLENNRKYVAEVIGTDPTTDVALIKVKAKGLPFVNYGDSDALRVGEWVLAVGNPFAQGSQYDLTSTVTAGIVSAKARSINIIGGTYGIESFIQTDAAVNPGNSGGALVNLRGELIGINTAIASPNRSYAGYSFAVPSTLVRKVVADLKEYGVVQRALLGVNINNVTEEVAEEKGLDEVSGVVIAGVGDKSAAAEAGLKPGDVVTHINNTKVRDVPELQELVARNRPGDDIKVTFVRDTRQKTVTATLRNTQGDTQLVNYSASRSFDGAYFVEASADLLEKLDLEHGVRISKVTEGKWKNQGVPEGFVITHVNKRAVSDVDEVLSALKKREGGNLIEGVDQKGTEKYYAIGW